TKAIAANVYPSPPARDLYFVVKGKPGRPVLAQFLEWVLTEGQKYVAEMGYIAVAPDRIASGLAVVRGGAEKR
ncbi:MAG: phosphate ABC transporter substrate-binding protein, partial [Candidatus Aminicenantales bacterium]